MTKRAISQVIGFSALLGSNLLVTFCAETAMGIPHLFRVSAALSIGLCLLFLGYFGYGQVKRALVERVRG